MALRVEWKWRVIFGVMIVAVLSGGCIENPDLFQPRALPDAGEVDDAEVCEPQAIDCEVVGGCGLFEDGCGEQVDCGLCPGEERLRLRPAEVVLEVGERATLEAVWRGEDGDRVADEALSWSSSDASVGVNAAGEVEALSLGEARVSAEAEDGSGRASAEVIVAASLAAIALELDPPRVHVGETRAVSALFYDTSGQPTAAREVSWSSSDEAVLVVDAEGHVRGVSSGQATVSAAVGGVRAELEVEVYFVWRDVELGGAFSCGLSWVGQAYCWGINTRGQLGDGTVEGREEPQPVSGDLRFERLSAGQDAVCGVTASGETYCWGSNGSGQAAVELVDATTRVLEPTQVVRRLPTGDEALSLGPIDSGLAYTCGVDPRIGRVYCWGINNQGQIGRPPAQGNPGTYDNPMVIGGDAFEARFVATAYPMACAQTEVGTVVCWGSQDVMKLEFQDDAPDVIGEPVALNTDVEFVQMGGGTRHFCGLSAGGELYCWGIDSHGELASGGGEDQSSPQPADTQARYVELAIGASHGCAITEDRSEVHCWGANNQNQIQPSGGKRESPTLVEGLPASAYRAVGAGASHSCVVSEAGDIFCFGRSGEGQLGPGEGWLRTLPRF